MCVSVQNLNRMKQIRRFKIETNKNKLYFNKILAIENSEVIFVLTNHSV